MRDVDWVANLKISDNISRMRHSMNENTLQRSNEKFLGAYGYAALLAALACSLAACSSAPPVANAESASMRPRAAASAPRLVEPAPEPRATEVQTRQEKQSVVLGNDRLINIKPSGSNTLAEDVAPISLNFENGDIREIVRNLLSDVLKESFIIDPAVQGTVTIRTAKPIRKDDIVPLLETILRNAKAVMVKEGNYWRILPEGGANVGSTRPRAQAPVAGGYGVTVLPVRYIGAKEMERVLLPFARAGTPPAIRVDELRNLLFLNGTEKEIATLLEVAEMFDVDILAGMSFLLHTMESADVKVVAADWEKIFPAATNPFAGLLRVVPIERMNAILLISPRREAIQTAKVWLERLDTGTDAGGGARLYVYQLQFSKAENLQVILQQAIGARGSTVSSQATVAPGQTASTIGSPVNPLPGQPLVTPGNAQPNPQPTQPNQTPRPPGAQQTSPNNQIGLARNATVVADKDRNALLIVATTSEYAAIESAIKKLDTPPKQVAVEFQLAQVTLGGNFEFGVSAFFQGKLDSPVNRLTSADGSGGIGQALDGATNPYSGFSYIWSKAGGAKAVLRTLQTQNKAKVLTAPTVITLDNQKANFSYGTQISVRTQTASATTTTSSTDSFQYVNTGLNINVTPRVTGSSIQLEIQTQNSTPGKAQEGNPNPPISQTSSQTTVIVSDGDTMLLGGLYTDTGGNSTGGLPLLSTIPVIGGLFGSQSWTNERSELVMLITPRILSSSEDTRNTVDELRRKLINIEQMVPEVSTKNLPTAVEGKAGALREAAQQLPSEFNRSLRIFP
jgi:general secretion pathway protein D